MGLTVLVTPLQMACLGLRMEGLLSFDLITESYNVAFE